MTDLPSLESLLSTDLGMGTLWRVKEEIWKQKLEIRNYASDRKWHPGLSIFKQRDLGGERRTVEETVPILYGSSGKKGPVVVKGISNDGKYDDGHTCVFGKIIAPILLGESKLEEKDRKDGPFGTELDDLWYKEFDVVPNRQKPRVNDEEYAQLENFLKRKMQDDE